MIWDDNGSGMQPQHHAGKPQGKPRGCKREALIVTLVVIAVLLIKAAGG